jgi:antitoxin YefM
MSIEITYTQARENLSELLDDVTRDREIVIIRRKDAEDVALIAASELSSLIETAYLLRSPTNAQRLISALGRAVKRDHY